MKYIKKYIIENWKKIINYIAIFVATVLFLFFTLVISSKIPLSAVKQHLEESIEFYDKLTKIKENKAYSYIHFAADVKKLDILYNIDTSHPIESVLWSKYYQKQNTVMVSSQNFNELIKYNKAPNTNYLRYWNGVMLFLRPLLIFFNMQQIYIINQIILFILIIILFIMLFKKSQKLAIIFLLSLLMVSAWNIISIKYAVTFYIMIITSMIALKIENNLKKEPQEKINEHFSKLFFVTGIVTTFFDFLTTELLTIYVPILIILILRKEENRLGSLKDNFKFVLKLSVFWFIGYSGMWIAKWILSALILHINVFEYVTEFAKERVNGFHTVSQKSYTYLYGNVLGANIFALPIMLFIQSNFDSIIVKIGTLLFIITLLYFINWKKIKKKKYLLIFVLIGVMPYIRYLILANHSLVHARFTFRAQIITIICFIYMIIDCLNYDLIKRLKSKVLKKKKKKTLTIKLKLKDKCRHKK